MKLIKLISVTLAFIMVFCGCGMKNTASGSYVNDPSKEILEQTEKQSSKTAVSLGCSITDSFDPYTAETEINRNLSPLMYESLIVLDNGFTPKYRLASKINLKDKTATVTLRSAMFADGSSITADDVVYCANKAMAGKTRYAYALADVSSVSASGYNTVVFQLKKSDPNFINQLDFPIFKAGSDKKTSSDNIEIPPIASGRYKINDKKTALTVNKNYFGLEPTVKKINLINTPDKEALDHNLQIGNITYHYSDLSDCSLSQVRGNYKKINSGNLVYLGANMKGGAMANVDMRQIVSAVIERNEITEKAYYQNAVPTVGIFHPDFKGGEDVGMVSTDVNNENVYLALLDKIGYNKKDNSGYYVNSAGERLTLKLISYKDNLWRNSAAELIKSQLKSKGINVTLEKYNWEEYTYALRQGHYDLYIAEVKIKNNMDVSQLVTKGGSAAYGIEYSNTQKTTSSKASTQSSVASDTSSKSEQKDYAGATAKAVADMYSGKASIGEVVEAFSAEMPIIPICYRTGIVSFSDGISGISAGISDIYAGLETANLYKN